MSEVAVSAEARARTLARFEEHRRTWDRNEALRTLYAVWHRRIRAVLPPAELGPWIEIGSGPGFARSFIPELQLTDVVQAPWHDRQISAETLPFPDDSVGALVMLDVLHHLAAPARFFAEASRVLRPGGRIVMCEPYMSPASYPVYKLFHEEPVDMTVHPLAENGGSGKDPFDGNQAIPTLLFRRRGRRELEQRFPRLRVASFETMSGLAYPLSGGFGRAPLLPLPLWKALLAAEERLPGALFRVCGFRLLATIERV